LVEMVESCTPTEPPRLLMPPPVLAEILELFTVSVLSPPSGVRASTPENSTYFPE